jgi:hypothetical protein
MHNLSQKNRKLSELFSSDPTKLRHGELRKGLFEYNLLLILLEDAISDFENNNLEKFDALVGENACQIRAVKIALLSSQNSADTSACQIRAVKIALLSSQNSADTSAIKQDLKNAKTSVQALLAEKNIKKIMHSDHSLHDIITSENLEILMSHDILYIYLSYLLCLMKEKENGIPNSLCFRDKCSPKKLKMYEKNISSSFAKALASKTRKLLSEFSVHFTRELAWGLKDLNLIQMVSDEFTHQYSSWSCIPMFWTYKTLLKFAHQKKIPLVIVAKFLKQIAGEYQVIDKEVLFYKPSIDGKSYHYIESELDKDDLTKAAVVIEGHVCLKNEKPIFCKIKWKERFSQNSIVDVILAGAADHRQYPDQDHTITFSDAEYDRYRSIAQNKGFSLANPTTFLISHVFPQQIGKILYFYRDLSSLSMHS